MEKKEILIVDYDRVILRTLEKILLRAGYSVIPLVCRQIIWTHALIF